jgi:hypothetical protein
MQQERAAEIQRGYNDFINEQKDGKPAHPHVEKVAPAIVGLIRGGLVPPVNEYGQPIPVRDQLARAYKMACDMDASIRPASTPKNHSRQVAKARAAGSVGVVAKSPAGQADVPERSIQEDLEATFERLSRRV